MEIVKKEISLNVGQPNNFELICAMQGDNKTFEITATLYDVNKLYNVTTDNIKLKGVNPVGQNICMDIDSHTEHTVTFTLKDGLLAYDGLAKLVLVFTESSKQLTSFPFVIKVINSPGDTSATDIITVSGFVEEAEKWALLSKSYAVGTENEIREGDAEDNSKYYYEQIKELLDSGEIGNGKILYFDTYEEFKKELDAGTIEDETLICIKEGNVDSSGNNSGNNPDDNIDDTVFASGTLIILGSRGYSSYSTDGGYSWNQLNESSSIVPFHTCNSLQKIEDNYFALVRDEKKIYKSSTLKYWNVHCTIPENCGCIYGNTNIFLIGGAYNNSFYSIDGGINWNATNIPVSSKEREAYPGDFSESVVMPEYNIQNFVCDNTKNLYLAAGDYGHSYYSTNGRNWTAISGLDTNHQYRAFYVNGNFFLAGYATNFRKEDVKTFILYKSSNAISWTKVLDISTSAYLMIDPSFFSIIFVNNRLVFINYDYVLSCKEDGSDYHITSLDSDHYTYAAVKHNNTIIAKNNSSKIILKSNDGITWTDIYQQFSSMGGHSLICIEE